MSYRPLFLLSLFVLAACGKDSATEQNTENTDATAEPEALVVYSSRNEQLIKPVFDLYTRQTGIDIKYTTDKAGVLIERLKAEGESTPADVLITVDAGNLGYAASQDLLAPMDSDIIGQNVPAHLRDPDNRWVGLSVRARTIVYSTERVSPEQLNTYEGLGSAQWRGRLCLRTAKKVYNQSLVAMLIAERGEEQAQQIVESWVANLAIPPTSNDTKVMEAIAAGQCDVGIVNTYYFGRLQSQQPDIKLALFWPDQENNGVHVNVSGAGVLKHSRHSGDAQAFIEWLASDDAQAIFGGVNQEYPVNPAIATDPQVASWGEFKASTFPLTKAAELQPAAVKLMDRSGYN